MQTNISEIYRTCKGNVLKGRARARARALSKFRKYIRNVKEMYNNALGMYRKCIID